MSLFAHLQPLTTNLDPATVVQGYAASFFPMAELDGTIYWHSPDPRAIIPLDNIRVSRSLRKTIERGTFEIRLDTSFPEVIRACCERRETWISDEIIRTYSELHSMGFAHCVESWQDGELVGGLYGVSIGGAFFGESMFSRVSDASKVAFVSLAAHILSRGFILLDTQYINPFTEQLGALEISRNEYLMLLQCAVQLPVSFHHPQD
ncbi:MAG: leucyl/phenylalanyl-tRNA--protein transferase [Candidatus Kapabacteria bacterium]|nr:leucyl/phenylalanyl-tRNA--protein transferase [Candidatus Kapabacteria bacterium]